jgi:hypothetical protein
MVEEKVFSMKRPKKLETSGIYGERWIVGGWKTRLEECL